MAKRCKIMPKPASSNAQVNLTNEKFIALITKINMIGEFDGQWIDIGTSHHFCYVRAMFKTYMNNKVLLGVAHATNVVGIGEVEHSSPLKRL